MKDGLATRFIALYVFLGVVVCAAGLGAYAAYQIPVVKHEAQAAIKQAAGDQNLTRLADAYIAKQVQAQGLAVTKIVVLRVDQKGDVATVTARVTITNGATEQTIDLKVSFNHSTWNATGVVRA